MAARAGQIRSGAKPKQGRKVGLGLTPEAVFTSWWLPAPAPSCTAPQRPRAPSVGLSLPPAECSLVFALGSVRWGFPKSSKDHSILRSTKKLPIYGNPILVSYGMLTKGATRLSPGSIEHSSPRNSIDRREKGCLSASILGEASAHEPALGSALQFTSETLCPTSLGRGPKPWKHGRSRGYPGNIGRCRAYFLGIPYKATVWQMLKCYSDCLDRRSGSRGASRC